MESVEFHTAAAMLAWQVELGADEAICDAPVDRYALPAALAKPAAEKAGGDPKAAKVKPTPSSPVVADVDVVAAAEFAAKAAPDLEALHAAIATYSHCDLRLGARNLVFGEGTADARVMIVGEAPNRDEDREGRPFIGAAGQLLDKMFEAIDMGRTHADAPIYITTVLPWRPPQDRDPKPEELAMMAPFLRRHIALVDPDIVVVMGNTACQALLGKRGITRLRGTWHEAAGRACFPMFHPDYLLRNPLAKRDAWADLLALQVRLREGANAGS